MLKQLLLNKPSYRMQQVSVPFFLMSVFYWVGQKVTGVLRNFINLWTMPVNGKLILSVRQMQEKLMTG